MTRCGLIPKPSRRSRAVLLSAVIAAALGGIANAYWQGSGSGHAEGTTAATVAVILSPGSPTRTLYPGGQADVVLTVSNPNESPLHVGTLSLDTSQGSAGFAVDAAHSACPPTTLSFSTQTDNGAGWSVPARSGATNGMLPVTLTNALTMDVGAENACQGASFTIYLLAGS